MYVEVDEKSRDGNMYMLNRHNTGYYTAISYSVFNYLFLFKVKFFKFYF